MDNRSGSSNRSKNAQTVMVVIAVIQDHFDRIFAAKEA